VAGDPYDLHGWKEDKVTGGWFLDKAEHHTVDGPPHDPTALVH
jgi:hypothetical protein